MCIFECFINLSLMNEFKKYKRSMILFEENKTSFLFTNKVDEHEE